MQKLRALLQVLTKLRLRSKISFGLDLSSHVDADQRVLLDFQCALDRVDEERKLAATMRVFVGGTLHLLRRQLHTHFSEYVAGLFEIDIAGLSHDPAPRPINGSRGRPDDSSAY